MTDGATGKASDSYGATWMMAAAAIFIAIGTALGQYDVSTIFLIAALLLVMIAVLAPRGPVLRILSRRSVLMGLVAGVTVHALAFTAQSPIADPRYWLALLGFAALGLHAVLFAKRWRIAELSIVIAGHFVLIGFLLAGAALLLVLLRAPRTIAGFCEGSVVVLMPFFLFGKQAFLNYYSLPLVPLALAIATTEAEPVEPAAVGLST